MSRLGHFPFILLTVIAIYVAGFKRAGITLDDGISTPLKDKLQSIVNACSKKGVEFNSDEINVKISSCFQLFNKLGEEENEYTDVKFPSPEAWADEDSTEVKTYFQNQRKNNILQIENFSKQFTPSLQCLESVKNIIDQCQSSEGITIFSVLEEASANDGLPFYELVESVSRCAGTRAFQTALRSCQQESGLIRKYFIPYPKIEAVVNGFCEIGAVAYNCLETGITSNLANCSQTSDLLQAFAEGVTSRASNAEALNQCIPTILN